MHRILLLVVILLGITLLSTFIFLTPQKSEQPENFLQTNCVKESANRYRVTTNKSFDDVMLDLETAIGNENYNITSINSVGKVIAKRHEIDFPNYAIVNSCNLESAKKFLEIDPEYVTIMPCRIAVWEQNGKVQVDAQLVPENDSRCVEICMETNALLKRVVDNAAEE